MNSPTVLVLPGYHGSGPAHWQSWLEGQLPSTRRVSGIDWERPVLADWSAAARRAIERSTGPLWLVAHSFGCLTAVSAAAGLDPGRIAGALLVAPADPERFSPHGVRPADRRDDPGSVADQLPRTALPFPSLVVASRNDPWMALARVGHWADCWGSALIDIGDAGHINIDSGFGPWPQGLALLAALQAGHFHQPHPAPTVSRHSVWCQQPPCMPRHVAHATL